MAHNARIRPSGFWTLGSVISPAEMEALDEAQFEALNADDGGVWAPTDEIIIGGAGLHVTGPANLDDVQSATIEGTVTIASGGATIIASGGTLTAASGSTVALAGATSQTGALTKSGAGGTTAWRVDSATILDQAADQTLDVSADEYAWDGFGSQSNVITVVLKETSPAPPANVSIIISRPGAASGARDLIVKRETGLATIATLLGSGAAAARFTFRGGAWRPSLWSTNVTIA